MSLPFSQPPSPSSRPPVTGYIVLHNITGSIQANLTNETEFTLEGIAKGIYIVTVQAVNILGVGVAETVIICATGKL